ncbi:ATP-dependent helicase [Cerasicoccus arenae]|uniref:DNA 3'-5' helicase n=1 Tax=Cerasicoccus arenae TaxID=424488 RepID=A0A8J3GCJ3_9BACT|nr:ATP-dependent helicase [Cerasicoccus arenae]MBK1856698.1 ATP-dependent helicase [Cerasicoccus arenae]GHB98988.1 ATP-dependent DNA helicase PcrA [Cerasicoccus arenae]
MDFAEPRGMARDAFAPIDYEAELNPGQLAAVTAADGPALVLAGAGSGKTRTLTYRVAYLLEKGVLPREILLLTFTNKAAREMLTRVEELTGVEGRKFWGGTFHSIGSRILRMYGESIGLDKNYTILDQGDSESLFGDVLKEVDGKFSKDKENPKTKVVLDMISYARNTNQLTEDIARERFSWLDQLPGQLAIFAQAYEAKKRAQQVCDYDDLLELWLKLLNENTEVRELLQSRFRYILVDEFQDTNTVQAAIINRMAEKHRNVMIVGDNWQCIYTWRGAEFGNMEKFANVYPERKIYKIEVNYRSSPEILRLANALMLQHPPIDGYPLELASAKSSNQRPYIVPTMDTRQQAQFVLRRVEGLQMEGVPLSDIAVLYRAHFQAMDLQMELSRQGVGYTITSGVRFFEQAHIRDFIAQLSFLTNPGNETSFKRVAGLLPKVGPKTAERLLKLAQKVVEKDNVTIFVALSDKTVIGKVPKDAVDDWTDMAYTLQNMHDALGAPVAITALSPVQDHQRDLFAEVLAEEKTSHTPKTPEEIVKIGIEGWYGDYLRTVYENWQSRRDDLDSLIGFASRYDSMTELLTQLVLLNSETSDRKIDPDSDTLRLSTIHQAKGLEFPYVFVLGCADELLPLKRAIEEGDVEEERRLLYVAVTRAMNELYLCYPKVTVTGGPPRLLQPSRFLRDIQAIGDDFYEPLHLQGAW